MTNINSKDVMELTVKELIAMVLEENGTFADFTFKEQVSNEVMAFISIGLFETAVKLKEIFNDAIESLNIDVSESFESVVSGGENE